MTSSDHLEQVQALLRRGDSVAALEILTAIPHADVTTEAWLEIARARRMTGDFAGAVEALDGVLAAQPRNFLALLSKGSMLEKLGRIKAAAVVYGNALTVVASEGDPPSALAAPLQRAREVVARHQEALARHLLESVDTLRRELDGREVARFDECLRIYAGVARAYVQQPLQLNFPRLPAIPFHDRGLFPWLAELESATTTVRDEMLEVLAADSPELAPYIAYPPGVPVNQWGALNHSRRWSSYFLWRDGEKQSGACLSCPNTARLLSSLPMADQSGFAPTAMFSVLDARTTIPPHTGSANTRLIVHLPLLLPGPARFRVGNVTREWALGEAWVFDDTIEHEAWNDAESQRVILIFDVWNPLLTEAERRLVTQMCLARRQYMMGS